MTKTYEKLKQSPQSGIDRSQLNYDERGEVRTIQVSGTTGLVQTNNPGKFTSIYYLSGDEEDAAIKFVDINKELLEQIDFSERNILQTSLNRDIYDLILDLLGERKIKKYETVVIEERRDGVQWVISRKRYETQANRRYTTSEPGSAKIPAGISLSDIYTSGGAKITESHLQQTPIIGDVRQVLDYFRVENEFNCSPVSTETGELGIQKDSC